MTYRPGDAVTVLFVTSRFDTGAATTADSLPAGTINKNGTDDGAVTVTVTLLETGRYKAVFTIPDTYLLGDVLNLSIAATVNSVAGKGVIWTAILVEQLVQRYSKATAGGANTVTLDAAASTTDNLYVGSVIEIYGGTGAGQARVCTAYNGTTKAATVGRNWVTNPASGSLCAILGLSAPKVDDSLQVSANVVQISGDSVAADNLETALDGGAFNVGGGAVVAASVTGNVGGSIGGNLGGDVLGGVAGSVGSVVGNVGGNVNGNVSGNVTGSVGSVSAGVSLGAGAITSTALASSGGNAIADALLKRDWTAITGEASRSVLNALRALRNRFLVAAGVYSVYKEDDAVVAWSAPVSTDATATPIVGVDPT